MNNQHLCPLCGGSNFLYAGTLESRRFIRCRDCGLLQAHQPEPVSAPDIDPQFPNHALSALLHYLPAAELQMAVIGGPEGGNSNLHSGNRLSIQYCAVPGEAASPEILLTHRPLQYAMDPAQALLEYHRRLPDGGFLILPVSLVETREFVFDHDVLWNRQLNYCFSPETIRTVLYKAGFEHLVFLTRDKDVCWIAGQKVVSQARPKLSVIMPVYNEESTVRAAIESVLGIDFLPLDLELIIVESRSTDNSRSIVQSFASDARVRIVLQEKARGKGHAVREGLRYATGTYLLIQDADSEYDVQDYGPLLEPLMKGRCSFVLGTRHSGDWKIRKFGKAHLSFLMNTAHWFLVYLMNTLYNVRMTDPFTMYKVFHRDCLFGLTFECNRFDFDYEIVCKFLRKRYAPLEIPVCYQSRSFEEGKKVRIFRDPPSWIKAIFKYYLMELPAPAADRCP